MTFLEILAEMGLDIKEWHYACTRSPTSEKDLLYVDEVDRRTKTLRIPKYFRGERNLLMTALRFLAAYGNYAYDDDLKPTSNKSFLDISLKILCELIMADSFVHNKITVRYSEVLETVNELIQEDYLYEFIVSFQFEWDRILREDESSGKHIRNKYAYMKSCLWDWLKRREIAVFVISTTILSSICCMLI